MDLIRENAYVTIQEMSQKIQVSDRSIKRDLQLLQQLGIIHRQGTRKLGYWEIIQRDNYKL